MDELGLPLQRPSKVPAYLFMAGSVVCAILSSGILAYGALYSSDTGRDFSRPVTAAAGVIGLLPLLGMRKFVSVKNKRATSVSGQPSPAVDPPPASIEPTSSPSTVLHGWPYVVMSLAVFVAAMSGFFQLVVAIFSYAACSPDCGP